MARVKFKVKQYTEPLQRAINTLPEVQSEMEVAGAFGEQIAVDMINSRPSAKSGKPGRATGTDMAPDVTHTVKATQPYRYQLRVGWLNRHEEWYSMQDQGFWYVHTAIPFWIEGTNALEETSDRVEDLMLEVVDKYRKRIKRIAIGKSK